MYHYAVTSNGQTYQEIDSHLPLSDKEKRRNADAVAELYKLNPAHVRVILDLRRSETGKQEG